MTPHVERCPRCSGPVGSHCSNPQCGWLRCSNNTRDGDKAVSCGTTISPERGEWIVATTGERGRF